MTSGLPHIVCIGNAVYKRGPRRFTSDCLIFVAPSLTKKISLTFCCDLFLIHLHKRILSVFCVYNYWDFPRVRPRMRNKHMKTSRTEEETGLEGGRVNILYVVVF